MLINNSMPPFNEEDQYDTYVDEHGNEYEYDEFWGGLKKIIKRTNPIRHITNSIKLLNPVNVVKLAQKVVTKPSSLNPFSRPKRRPIRRVIRRPVRIISRPRPMRSTSLVDVALNKPISSGVQHTKAIAPKQAETKLQDAKPKKAGLLGNNKLAVAVAVLVVGGLIFHKMKPTAPTAK
jgi:hypothetical protein